MVVMSIIPKIVRDFFIESPEYKAEKERQKAEKYQRAVDHASAVLKDSGITCRCNGIAIPTAQKGKIYRCIRCNKQFANAWYNLGDTRNAYQRRNNHPSNARLNMYYYDEAVDLLVKEDQ